MSETFLDGKIEMHCGDSREVLKQLADCSIDSVVTDPPYALVSIVKRFANSPRSERTENTENPYGRTGRGFMGQKWDNGSTAFCDEFWAEVLRVLKPGGHIVAFSGTRTYHRMVCAIEDAGFEIRDQIGWAYGSGFPQSHDVSKGIDRSLGLERSKVRVPAVNVKNPKTIGSGRDGLEGATRPWIELALERGFHELDSHEAISDEAGSWRGWGTALKPAWEPIVLARKRLIGTVAANVLAHGTGALNIDGCRVGLRERPKVTDPKRTSNTYGEIDSPGGKLLPDARWPANICHDGSEEVLAAFPDIDTARSTVTSKPGFVYGNGAGLPSHTGEYGADESGSAARFFYTAKADADDRLGSKHPTVKPLDLMQWLVRLVTPPNGTVLDCFAGTGTTGEAAWREGMRAVLIEREAEYQADIRRRMKLAACGPDERGRESIKARGLTADAGPLFAETYDGQRDLAGSLDVGYAAIRERMAAGGPGWTPGEPK